MNDALASEEDIRFAYRLLLGRRPDPDGLTTWRSLLRQRPMRPHELAECFLGSNEFRSRYESRLDEVELDGFVVLVRSDDTDIGRALAHAGAWEPNVTAVLRQRLGSGAAFLDVGANIGYFSALAAHLVGGGRVVAVEPMDKNLQLIYATIARNGFAQVEVHPFAAGDTSAIVCMGTQAGSSNGQIEREWKGAGQPLYAQTRRLDDLLGSGQGFDMVKFDIEGYELHAWRGFERGLARDRPLVLTEFHPRCMRENALVDPHEYAAVLIDYGNITVLHADGRRSACDTVESLMRAWQREDADLRGEGAAHLDLLVEPRA
ncbi:MAG: FkbM family methyltransferase [Xanthomonadales bacterium]|nr:FkbM family methyltransferase [Xanthomonadales bacterium]